MGRHFFIVWYLCKCKDTYSILQNKYLCIYEDSFGAKELRDDCAHGTTFQFYTMEVGSCSRLVN